MSSDLEKGIKLWEPEPESEQQPLVSYEDVLRNLVIRNRKGDTEVHWEGNVIASKSDKPVSELPFKLWSESRMKWEDMKVKAESAGKELEVVPVDVWQSSRKVWKVKVPLLRKGDGPFRVKWSALWQGMFPVRDPLQAWEETPRFPHVNMTVRIVLPTGRGAQTTESYELRHGDRRKLEGMRGIQQETDDKGRCVLQLHIQKAEVGVSYVVLWEYCSK